MLDREPVDDALRLMPYHQVSHRPACTQTRAILNWIDLMERALEQQTPVPVAASDVPVAPAKNLPGSKVTSAHPEPKPTPPDGESRAVKLLRYMDDYEHRYGYMPTYQEIARHLQVKTPSLARYCVVSLEKAGLVHIEMYARRGITITDAGRAALAGD